MKREEIIKELAHYCRPEQFKKIIDNASVWETEWLYALLKHYRNLPVNVC